ncbi:methyltransferase [Pseudomonas sp. D1-1]|uniref:methyltransferase n=1 Tax=Pseudomonas sp. D1-1 TaxID=1040793 RepID=UPI003DA82B9F
MNTLLRQAGYRFDENLKIWSKPGYSSINYSDGDNTELRIKFLLDQASDVSVFSDELRRSCTDWPSMYYLSSSRSNLLRVFEAEFSGDVLEIGAGCGAITRYLGEQGGRVLALEGSYRRASIARTRTRDLENVSVLAESFEDFDIDKKFDVVTLIGVFEYANLFISGDSPGPKMLEKVRSLLKPDGLLIIAIENQLGLKYFAGAPEDHVSAPMFGVEGRYSSHTPQTYGKKALSSLLADAGFSTREFMAPFPDYKLPVSVVTERGFNESVFDACAFATQTVRRDPQLPKLTTFSLELSWPQIISNGLGLDMANSFLIAASAGSRKRVEPEVLAVHYSCDRRAVYCKRSEFRMNPNDGIRVHYEKLGKLAANASDEGTIVKFRLPESEPYIQGEVFVNKLIHIVNAEGWTYADVGAFLKQYVTVLGLVSETAGNELNILPGTLIDAVPQNIIVNGDSSPQLIDKEWALNSPVRLEFLLFKTLTQLLSSVTRFAKGAESGPVTRRGFVFKSCEAAGYPISDNDVKDFLLLEASVQNVINGREISEFLSWDGDQIITEDNLFSAFNVSQTLLAQTSRGLNVAEEEIDRLSKQLVEREAIYGAIVSSNSWLITKPLRFFARSLRKGSGCLQRGLEHSKKTLTAYLRGQEINASMLEATHGVVEEPVKRVRSISVILPIYRDVEMTRRCILAAMPGIIACESKLIALNDYSPDAGMQDMLLELQKQWPDVLMVLENQQNLGFVKTVNRGMRHRPEDDIVFLNSDVIVPVDWLERLASEAYIAPNIGTVTPFSNNATICSFPAFLLENEAAFGLSVDEIDSVFSNPRLPVAQVPTGVGFCMYVRRDCLELIGLLNEEKFGRGYGEENDLCQRGLKAGWLNIVTPNLYAFHEGGVSFSSSKQALTDHASKMIAELHPDYHLDIQRFIVADPLKSVRIRRFAQLIGSLDRPKVLHISHEAGGGVRQHLEELAEAVGSNACCLFLAPHRGTAAITLRMGLFTGADELVFQLPKDHSALVALLKACGVNLVHFHHSLGLNPALLELPAELDAAYALTVHDYYWLCGNPTLTNQRGFYPGAYADNIENPNFPLPRGVSAQDWREQLRGFIEHALKVIFPSSYTLSIYKRHYELANAVIAGHVEHLRNIHAAVTPLLTKSRYNVGVIGALGKEKGADYLEQMAAVAFSTQTPIDFKLIGFAYRELNGIKCTGHYESDELAALIKTNDIDLFLFPSQCPETYSYTLSFAMESGLPIIAPDIGAFPERLSGRNSTLIYEYGMEPAVLLSKVQMFIKELAAGQSLPAPCVDNSACQDDFYNTDYLALCHCGFDGARDSQAVLQLPVRSAVSADMDSLLTYKELMLLALWTLYRKPGMHRVRDSVPYEVRQKIKRMLTKRPLYEVVGVHKK